MKPLKILAGIGVLFVVPILNSCFPDLDEDGYPEIHGVTNIVAVAGNGQATISWGYPKGSENIFVVEYDTLGLDSLGKNPDDADPCYLGWVGGLCGGVITTDTMAVITGLTNGKTYKINVVAKPPQGVDSSDGWNYSLNTVLTTPTAN